MVKYILSFVVLSVSLLNAQIVKSYGVKVGITSSSEKWAYTPEYISDSETNSKLGINLSGFVELLDIPFISVVTEIGYNQKGMKDKIAITSIAQPDGTGEYKTVSNRVDYLETSALLKLNYETPFIKPYIFAGPRLDLLIGKDADSGYNVVYDDFNTTVYGLKLGIGAEVGNILPYSLLAEFQYNHDLSDVYKTDNLKIENNSFELKIGFLF